MNKKKKIKKRILALLGVFVILVGVIMVPVGAWEMTDISFYNYFNNGLLTVTYNDGRNAYIQRSEVETGYIYFGMNYNGNNVYYVPTQYVNRPLRDFCPDMKVGETYCLSNEFKFIGISPGYTSVGDANPTSLGYMQLNNPTTNEEFRWYYGTSIVVTDELLESLPMIFACYIPPTVKIDVGAHITTRMRIWINKGTIAQEFCSYDMARVLNKVTYEQGKIDGYNEYLNRQSLFTDKSFVKAQFFYHRTDTDFVAREYNASNVLYAFSGYNYGTRNFDSSYYTAPYAGFRLQAMNTLFDLTKNETPYYFGTTPLLLNLKGCSVKVRLYTSNGNNEYTAQISASNEPRTVDINDFFDIVKVGEIIESIDIYVNAINQENGVYDPYFYASLSVANTGGVEYLAGLDAGLSANNAKAFNEGYSKGEENGYDKGFAKAKGYYYKKGTDDGYYKGYEEGQKGFKFVNMITTLVDVPVSAFRNLFNFNLLGVDMSSFALSLITVALCITIIKKVI